MKIHARSTVENNPRNLLYYPYINIPRSDWSIRALLYYDNVGFIAPQRYFYNPENYDYFTKKLILNELITPIDPMEVLQNPWEISQPFIQYLESRDFNLERRQLNFRNENENMFNNPKYNSREYRMHADKFDSGFFYNLEQAGLARRENDEWYFVEQKTANDLMIFLASVIGGKLNYLPATDNFKKSFSFSSRSKKVFEIKNNAQKKREIILNSLIPFPQEVDLEKLKKFKNKHSELLEAFRTKVELIALNANIKEDSTEFIESINDLNNRKKELFAKMNEGKLGKIFFGTICGISGAAFGLAASGPTGMLAGLPAFINSIYSALKLESAENIFDQSGMKYIALIDKKLKNSLTWK